jgi:geranylgeranyl diphosphate synthase type II
MGYPTILEPTRRRFEAGLQAFVAGLEGPTRLQEAMGYVLSAGGKRVRPVLLLSAAELFPLDGPLGRLDPIPAACALELVHTYSLVHDDLPAMDDDDLRRGRPTCHKAFGEALAILTGDALLTEAFGLLARGHAPAERTLAAVAELCQAAGAAGMIGGQVLDTLETGKALELHEVERIHRLKTGALLTAAVRIGGLLGGAGQDDLAALTRYARQLGLAFQVADDLLDVSGQDDQLGKTAGKDRAMGKTTYADLLGQEDGWRYARALAEEARAALRRFGGQAAALEAMADFIVQRDC